MFFDVHYIEEIVTQLGEMAGLGNIRNRLMLPTADGFVITTLAFTAFMERLHLVERARQGTAFWQDGNYAGLRQVSRKIQNAILHGSLPRNLTLNPDLC